MKEFLRLLRARFDMVLLDSPPVMAVADASILSSLVDGVILVVRSGLYPRKVIKDAREHLEATGARLLGVVLNDISSKDGGYYVRYPSRYYKKESAV